MLNKLKYLLLPRRLKKRFSYDDYLYYRLQERRITEIEEFLNIDELWETEARLNNDDYRNIFNSKKMFYKTFEKYIKRDYLLLQDTTQAKYLEFIRKHDNCVLKPDDMYAGLGIKFVNIQNISSFSFDDLKEKNYILEEYVKGNKEYCTVYPNCLNTVRVTTLVGRDGKARILFAANQFGSRGSLVDNNDETAIWGVCDVNSGIIVHADIDDNTGHIYDRHPDTDIPIVGFCNPQWTEITQTALEAALIIPQCRLIGWDIAVNENNEILIIEGNVTPELDLYQRFSGKGLSKLLRD